MRDRIKNWMTFTSKILRMVQIKMFDLHYCFYLTNYIVFSNSFATYSKDLGSFKISESDIVVSLSESDISIGNGNGFGFYFVMNLNGFIFSVNNYLFFLLNICVINEQSTITSRNDGK